jgi:hypothetical protein
MQYRKSDKVAVMIMINKVAFHYTVIGVLRFSETDVKNVRFLVVIYPRLV